MTDTFEKMDDEGFVSMKPTFGGKEPPSDGVLGGEVRVLSEVGRKGSQVNKGFMSDSLLNEMVEIVFIGKVGSIATNLPERYQRKMQDLVRCAMM